MTDPTPAPTEMHAAARESDERRGIPAILRILGGLGLAALLVAVYAGAQIRSGDSPAATQTAFDQTLGGGEYPKVGSIAPDFSVATLDGETFSLSRHLDEDGRPVLVNMWAEWCFHCRAEMPAIEAISQKHPEIHFIGVVIRDREAPARNFVEELGITYQIGLDTDRKVERAYFVWPMPTTYLIGSDGVIIGRFFGPRREPQFEELVAKAVS